MRVWTLTGLIAFLALALLLETARAQGKSLTLATDLETGPGSFLKHLLPRFMLKTSVRVTPVAPNDPAADMRLDATGETGTRAFRNAPGTVWRLVLLTDNAHGARFRDWLTSDIGQRTIESYRSNEVQIYFRPTGPAVVVEEVMPEGDTVAGERLALIHCGRCHVVSEKNKYGGIGSTPSFGALRTIADWQDRFATFWTLNPHPSFSQVDGMTDPFDPARPPAIAPLFLTLEDVEAITAFAATIPPKDLGAPIQPK